MRTHRILLAMCMVSAVLGSAFSASLQSARPNTFKIDQLPPSNFERFDGPANTESVIEPGTFPA